MYQYEWIEDAVAHVWMNELYFFYFIKLSFIKDRTNLDSTFKTQNFKKKFFREYLILTHSIAVINCI